MTQITVTVNVSARVVNDIRAEIESGLFAELDEFGIAVDAVSIPKKNLKAAVDELLPSTMVAFEKEVEEDLQETINDGSTFVVGLGDTAIREQARKIIKDADLTVKSNKALKKADIARAIHLAAKHGLKLVKE